jgi:hypothetical protein
VNSMKSSLCASLLKRSQTYKKRIGIIELVETVDFLLNYSKIVGLKI